MPPDSKWRQGVTQALGSLLLAFRRFFFAFLCTFASGDYQRARKDANPAKENRKKTTCRADEIAGIEEVSTGVQ
jgi:hypothetical protein